MQRFVQFDDFLPAAQLETVQQFFQSKVFWTFGWQSDRENVPFSHWNHDFLKTHRANQDNSEDQLLSDPELAPISDLWRKLKAEHLQGHALVRCYANAHTFGVEGYPHVDSRKPGNYTTIVYINPIWKPEWAGETVFLNDAGDIFQAVLPKPGRITIFDGRVTHAARGLSRICPAMRVTLMFKTTAPGAESDSKQA
jgi:Rps23 Pro-64 3,4-dihydroxylase Tpa1-like proline 4-hydroxylase